MICSDSSQGSRTSPEQLRFLSTSQLAHATLSHVVAFQLAGGAAGSIAASVAFVADVADADMSAAVLVGCIAAKSWQEV